MRSSRTITLTLLSGLMLTGCCLFSQGCSRGARDHTWYDANGHVIQERWKTDAQGNKLLDAQGRPIPEPGVPYDRYHRPWVYTGGVWAPLAPPVSSSSRSRSWFSGGSGYRSTGTSTSYRPGFSSGSSSISRGGFGTTGFSSSS